MSLSELCIKRPVFTIVLSLILVVLGLIAFQSLTVKSLPDIDKPMVFVRTTYTGANPDLVENEITTPIEDAISSVNGIEYMESTSEDGTSHVKLHFELGADINAAVQDVHDKIDNIAGDLPDDADTPIVEQADSDSQMVMGVSVTDDTMSNMAITDYINRYIEPRLMQVNGVDSIDIMGGMDYSMRVWLDPAKMAARNITAEDVTDALAKDNIDIPSGQIKSQDRNFSVMANEKLKNVAAFKNLVIQKTGDTLIRLSDVAKVNVAAVDSDTATRIEGKPGVVVGVVPKSTANPITISAGIRSTMQELGMNLPKGMKMKVLFDMSDYINQSIKDVYQTFAEAFVCVVAIIFLFLGAIRSATIPVVTIPVCLIASFGLIYALGYSINMITLLALILAVGLVVDDAIVVLENIHRHIEGGMSALAAAKKGSREILFAIIAMTITLAAVYIPVGFTHDITGVVLRQFAYTLAGAVLISGFVAMTLTPMMCSRWLGKSQKPSRYAVWLEYSFDNVKYYYQNLLSKVLDKKIWVAIVVIALAGLGYGLYKTMPSEMAPPEDMGFVMSMLSAPTDASFTYTDKYAKQVENILNKVPEKQSYLMAVSFPDSNQAFSVLSLKPWGERSRSQQDIVNELRVKYNNITGVSAFPISPSLWHNGGMNDHDLSMMIMSTGSYQDLYNYMESLKKSLADYPGITNTDSNLKLDKTQYAIDVQRDKAADLGVSMDSINDAMSVFLGGKYVSDFYYGGKAYEIIAQMQDSDLKDIKALDKIYVKSDNDDKMIPLSSLVTISQTVGPVELDHFDRMRAAKFEASLAPGYSMGQVIDHLNQVMPDLLGEGKKYAFSGRAKNLADSSHTTTIAFTLAMVFIYLVLAAQFESFIDPLIILLSVPLCIVGAIVSLKIVGGSFNIYSNIGMLTLIGLIAKHGILITEFANQAVERGAAVRDAVIEAATLRLRPILMTTLAMVFGAVPLAIATGAGAADRQQIGCVIVGGMLVGTFFSLFVVPCAYITFAKFKK